MKIFSLIGLLFMTTFSFGQTVLEFNEKDTIFNFETISEVNDKIVIRGIFIYCRYGCDYEDSIYLSLTDFILTHANWEFEISYHTDALSNDSYNQRLSQRRAEHLKKFFMNKGINNKRIKTIGYGETQILNHCKNGVRCSDSEHQYNRRLEIKLISKNKS